MQKLQFFEALPADTPDRPVPTDPGAITFRFVNGQLRH